MKKLYLKRTVALFLSMILIMCSCVFETIALENDIDNIFVNMEYDNEFYIAQNESVKIYNDMLNNFSTANNNTTYSLNSGKERDSFPEYYGGAYIDEEGKLVVLVTEMTSEVNAKVRQATGEKTQVETGLCSVSYNEMCSTIDYLTDKINMLKKQGVHIDMISDDIMNGKVVISIVDLTDEKEKIVRDLIDCDFLSFVNSKNIEEDVSVVGGGYGISSDVGTSTVGFAAVYLQNGEVGLVAAGHAFPDLGDTAYYNGDSIGLTWETAYYDNSTADASYITLYDGVEVTSILKNNGYIMSASTLEAPVNTTVYMYGNKSGLKSGKIISSNSTITHNGTNIRLTHQCKASYSSQGGDSGAPILFYEGNYGGKSRYTIRGIHSAHSDTHSFFSQYKYIAQELGISAVTS